MSIDLTPLSDWDSDEEKEMSYEERRKRLLKMGCQFCGSMENIRFNFNGSSYAVGHVYCIGTKCERHHEQYGHLHDLTHGLPYELKRIYQINMSYLPGVDDIQCHYCGNDDENLECVPIQLMNYTCHYTEQYTQLDLLNEHHQWFCRNNRCLKRYTEFFKQSKFVVPYIVHKKLGCVCKSAVTSCVCSPYYLNTFGCYC